MLKQRVITALVLLLVCLPALFAQSVVPFLVLTLLMCTLGAWEWSRMNSLGWVKSPVFALFTLITCALSLTIDDAQSIALAQHTLLVSLVLIWGIFFAMVLRWGIKGWRACPALLRLFMGWVAMSGAWMSFTLSKALGTPYLISVLVLVWTADIGAYFVGKAWGKSKLAPVLSPGKSREGALGGWVLVLMVGLLWLQAQAQWSPLSSSIFSLLWDKGPIYFVLGLSVLVACSVLGDLFESLVKRSAGFKDSSQLLPGHGGVLDRIDALLPTVPMALALVDWVSWVA